MSYRIVREVRAALKDGRVTLTGKTALLDRLVFVLLADDCRDNTRLASVGMEELSEIAGVHRTTISRSIGRLEKAGCIIRASRGGRDPDGKRKTSAYEIPVDFGCSTQAATSNEKLDVALEKLDVALEPVGCSTQGVTPPGNSPGTYPGVEKPSSLRSDGKEIPRSQAHAATAKKTRPASALIKEPLTPLVHLEALRECFTGDPVSAFEVTLTHLGTDSVTNGQIENVYYGLRRAVQRGLAAMEGTGKTRAVFWPLPTTGWPDDEISNDVVASRTRSRIGPEQ